MELLSLLKSSKLITEKNDERAIPQRTALFF